MTRKERNKLNYLRKKELVCVLDDEERYELYELELKENNDEKIFIKRYYY